VASLIIHNKRFFYVLTGVVVVFIVIAIYIYFIPGDFGLFQKDTHMNNENSTVLSNIKDAQVNHSIQTSHSSLTNLEPEIEDEVKRLSEGEPGELKEELLPDGSTVVHLKGRYRHVPVASIDEHGNIVISEYSKSSFKNNNNNNNNDISK